MWILIIVLFKINTGIAIAHVEFSSETLCNAAMQVYIENNLTSPHVDVRCFKK